MVVYGQCGDFMRIIISGLALEVTRKCNEKCKHCMRGEAQDLDLSKKYVDKLLSEENLIILQLVFSGGEPILNEELILYTINKIIDENIAVLSISMTTNGTIYSENILNAFERFSNDRGEIFEEFAKLFGIDKYSIIRFSNDQFHKNYNNEIVKKYLDNAKKTIFNFTGMRDVLEDEILLTGRAKEKNNFPFGKYFDYDLKKINMYSLDPDIFIINDTLYISATGNITSRGDGAYEDMDKINMGSYEDFSFDYLTKLKDEDVHEIKKKMRQIKKW